VGFQPKRHSYSARPVRRLNEATIDWRMYSLARSRRAPPVATAFVKPYQLIYNKAAMPVPFTNVA
jgi:hypothetical protein